MASTTRSKAVGDDVIDVLRKATVEGNHLKLQSGQLDRDLYKRVNDVLTRLGGKWRGGKTAAHVFDRDPAPLLADLLGSGKVAMPPKNPLNFFPTPRAIVLEMIERAEIPRDIMGPALRILEPSAGEGAIAEALLDAQANVIVQCVELDPVRAQRLRDQGWGVVEADFLDWAGLADLRCPFDRVLMNPPFVSPDNATVYVDHVLHAYGFLKPGGRLVALCPAGFTFNRTRKLATFLDWVDDHGYWIGLAPGAFRESGTDTNVCLVVVDKPVSPGR